MLTPMLELTLPSLTDCLRDSKDDNLPLWAYIYVSNKGMGNWTADERLIWDLVNALSLTHNDLRT